MFAILNSSLSFLFLSHFVTSREKEREREYEMEFEKTALKQKKYSHHQRCCYGYYVYDTFSRPWSEKKRL